LFFILKITSCFIQYIDSVRLICFDSAYLFTCISFIFRCCTHQEFNNAVYKEKNKEKKQTLHVFYVNIQVQVKITNTQVQMFKHMPEVKVFFCDFAMFYY